MTHDEMIDALKGLVFGTFDRTTAKEREALDMAIQALEQEPCEDTVSREAVIALAKEECETAIIPYKRFVKGVNALPPVTPKQRWIPVSERLPEDGRPVLIYAWNVHHVIARYDEFRTANGYKKTWVTADAWNGNTEIKHEVIAWMPLPEPYKEGESE
jgi:hypothetical protein